MDRNEKLESCSRYVIVNVKRNLKKKDSALNINIYEDKVYIVRQINWYKIRLDKKYKYFKTQTKKANLLAAIVKT